MNGTYKHPITGAIREYESMPVFGGWLSPPPFSFAHALPTGAFAKSDMAWKVLAEANPNAPDFSLPTFIAELRDLPSLLKDWGTNLFRKVARGNLSWRWVIRPMIRDIQKMINFVDTAQQRFAELKKLRDGKFLKRRVSLGSGTEISSSVRTFVHTRSGVNFFCRQQVSSEYKRWATVRYIVDPSFELPRDDNDLQFLADRLASGLTTHEALATAWELLPWSWLVDWFVDVGDLIALTNNTVPLIWSSVSVMQTTVSKRSYSEPDLALRQLVGKTKNEERATRKQRIICDPWFPIPPISLPIFDMGKWSILGSLAVLKDKSYRRRR